MANTGRVVQVQGGVVDVEFADGQLPELFEAIEIEREGQTPLVLEVQKFLGDNWVRTVSMDTTDGLQRGVDAVADTGIAQPEQRTGVVHEVPGALRQHDLVRGPTRGSGADQSDGALPGGDGQRGTRPQCR